ncbi:unnamed protein product [Cylicocyclus nassatus]|uniref:Potassium channel tetramerisation-type BTB domain-containing protein n=1 Tax=Cylicocyclus nassatus TaxID=53992 RepID=A0AA36DS48_CYLNA|nr:unnamed protein product [Cylicocyclus nassatus]
METAKTLTQIVELPLCDDRIRINVGGSVFETSFSTLTNAEGSVLSAMAKRGRNQEELFIDRDPTYFAEQVLNYLRDGKSFCSPIDDQARDFLHREADREYYKLPGLAEMCLRTEFQIGDTVQWNQTAIGIYWKFFVRYQYHEREWAGCMACGDNVFGYVGQPPLRIKRSRMRLR